MAVATLAGIIIGVFTALFRGGFVDKFLSTISVIFISTPVFWAAIMLVLVFSLWLDWAPASTMGPAGLSAYILPAFVLGSRSAGYIARLTRSTMLDALSSDYIQTALAKGLPRWRVTVVHALRNSLIPVVTLVGIDFGSYLNGSVLTEKIFGIDGIGRYAINAIMKRDIPVIMGTVTFGALIFIAVNLIVDLLYFKLDARVSGAQVQDVI
jgi:ABC-type dipeptide/oligopeptide/nickel transport system permease component